MSRHIQGEDKWSCGRASPPKQARSLSLTTGGQNLLVTSNWAWVIENRWSRNLGHEIWGRITGHDNFLCTVDREQVGSKNLQLSQFFFYYWNMPFHHVSLHVRRDAFNGVIGWAGILGWATWQACLATPLAFDTPLGWRQSVPVGRPRVTHRQNVSL